MIVAIHAIALNEAKHVDRWSESITDADHVVVADTGSSDGTEEMLRGWGHQTARITVDPWRFDLARNAAWALIPDEVDVVIKLDLDEVLVPGWRDALEKAWAEIDSEVCRFQYTYVWNWKDGVPDVQFNGDGIASRNGWHWVGPCHETLRTTQPHQTVLVQDLAIHHHADDSKPRTYLPLLAMAVKEEPDNDRMAHYYARELFFQNQWVQARIEFERHLALPTAVWAAERAASYRYLATMDAYPERWLLKALAEDPDRRESWVALAQHYARTGERAQCIGAVARALSITERPMDYIASGECWDDGYLQRLAHGVVLDETINP